MRSMLVIGLGRFGKALAVRLAQLGNEVMAVDLDETVIDKIAPQVTTAQIGDMMDEDVVAAVGPGNFDVCFVCISESLQSALEITSLLKERGAKRVVAKADSDLHAKFLLRLGADEVVYPERDMAARAAMHYSMRNAFDYFELADDYAVFEMAPPEAWVGRSVADVQVRTRYGVNVIAYKQDGHTLPMTDAGHVFTAQEHLLVAGGKADVQKLAGKG